MRDAGQPQPHAYARPLSAPHRCHKTLANDLAGTLARLGIRERAALLHLL